MKKITILCLLIVFSVFTFAQIKSVTDGKIAAKKALQADVNPNAMQSIYKPSSSTNNTKATWDVLFTFDASAAGNPGIETDGTNFYTVTWSGGDFTRYDMDGLNPTIFTIAGVTNIRDMAYDGTYFYGSDASMTIQIMDLANEASIGTIPVTCTGVTGVRHIAYDPTLDGGNGGFWVGNWNELGAISMTGAELVPSTVTLESCYGSAYDPWTDLANPCLWLFQQPTGAEAIFYQFDINTYTMTGVTHDASDVPGYLASSISGGACTYEDAGIFILAGSIQQDPNLVFAYELAYTASPSAPDAVVGLTVTPDAGGALTYDITWDNPTLNVGGTALTDITSISFYVDLVLETVLIYDLVVGATNTFPGLTVATPGYHTFKVVCTNGAGDGIPASVTEWIGFIPPDNITFSNIEDITADVAWTQVGTPDSWDIEILTTGTPPTGTPTYNTVTNPYPFTGLTASTTYDVYMRAVYAGGNSLWVGPFTFTTQPCPTANQCGYLFEFIDDFGDGWNGAAIDVMQNGVSIGQFTLASGAAGSQTVNICDAASIDLIWIAGSWDVECGFTLKNPFGDTLTSFAVGAAPLAGSFYTFTSSCTPVGINNNTVKEINIYPNPTTGTLNITNAENADVYVYNILGEVVASINNAAPFSTIDMSELSEGTYIVKILTDKNVITKKINLIK